MAAGFRDGYAKARAKYTLQDGEQLAGSPLDKRMQEAGVDRNAPVKSPWGAGSPLRA